MFNFFSSKGLTDVIRNFVNDHSVMAAPSLIVPWSHFQEPSEEAVSVCLLIFLRADFFTIVHT